MTTPNPHPPLPAVLPAEARAAQPDDVNTELCSICEHWFPWEQRIETVFDTLVWCPTCAKRDGVSDYRCSEKAHAAALAAAGERERRLVAEVERLQAELRDAYKGQDVIEKAHDLTGERMMEAERERDALRLMVGFYADPLNYISGTYTFADGSKVAIASPIEQDKGQQARAALALVVPAADGGA